MGGIGKGKMGEIGEGKMGEIGEGKVGEIGEGRRKRFHLHLPSRVVELVPGELQLIGLPLEAHEEGAGEGLAM